jgi:hypothetical protein
MNELLIKSIKLLAATPDEQRDYLKKSGSFPCTDEIALEFDDAYRYFAAQEEDSMLLSISNKLKRINAILEALSNSTNESDWNENSLNNSAWTEVRKIAISILEESN